MSKRILIVGATSSICRHISNELVQPGDSVCLAARNREELSNIAADLEIRNSPQAIFTRHFDSNEFDGHEQFVHEVSELLGGIDIVVVATGVLGDQIKARSSTSDMLQIINSNFTGIATVLGHVANVMEYQKSGHIIVLSSVAGDRGRQSNYIYGAAKSAINAYMGGLRNRLFASGAKVTTVKLGFVDTKMIAGMESAFLQASPEYIAKKLVSKITKSDGVIYLPWFWRYIMMIIIHIPVFIFKRLKL